MKKTAVSVFTALVAAMLLAFAITHPSLAAENAPIGSSIVSDSIMASVPNYQDAQNQRDKDTLAKPPTKKERLAFWGSFAYIGAATAANTVCAVRDLNTGRGKALAIGANVAFTSVTMWASHGMYKGGHPKIATVLNFFVGSIHTGLAVAYC